VRYIKLLLGLFLFVGLAACSNTSDRIDLELASDYEKLPQPRFQAREANRPGQLPQYNEIRVYDVTSCQLPYCPLMWRIILPDNFGAGDFYYGGQPTFGAHTINSAKTLQPNSKYEVVVGPVDKSYHYQRGQLGFEVNEAGEIVPLGE